MGIVIKSLFSAVWGDYSRFDQKNVLREMALLCSFFRRFSPVFASVIRQKKHMGLNFSGHLHPNYYNILILFGIYIKKGVQGGVQPRVQVGCKWGAILSPGCKPHRAVKRLHPDESLQHNDIKSKKVWGAMRGAGLIEDCTPYFKDKIKLYQYVIA